MGFFKKLLKYKEKSEKKARGQENTQQNEYDVYGEIFDQYNSYHDDKNDNSGTKSPLLGTTTLEMYENAVKEIEKRMTERRNITGRPYKIEKMSELQLREEFSLLHREYWVLKRNFGKPTSDAEKKTIRSTRRRYHRLKRKKSSYDER